MIRFPSLSEYILNFYSSTKLEQSQSGPLQGNRTGKASTWWAEPLIVIGQEIYMKVVGL
jgi:hypothetical protein